MRNTAGSIGSILEPALVVLFAPALDARSIFLVAALIVTATLVILLASSSLGDRQKTALVRFKP